MEEIRIVYRSLLIKYAEIRSDLNALNSTCIDLQEQIDDLTTRFNSTCGDLQEQIDSLNSTLQELYNSLNTTLTSEQESIKNELSTLRNLTYIFITTTVYSAIRKPKTKPETR